MRNNKAIYVTLWGNKVGTLFWMEGEALSYFEFDPLFLEIRDDNAFDHGRIRRIRDYCHGAFDDLEPILHEIREQYVFVILDAFGRNEAHPLDSEYLFRPFLVSLHRKTGCDPFGFALSERVGVTEYRVKVPVLFAEMS